MKEVKDFINKALLSLADQAEVARGDGCVPLPSLAAACSDRERMLMMSMFKAYASKRDRGRSRSPRSRGGGGGRDGGRDKGRGGKANRRSRSPKGRSSKRGSRSRSPKGKGKPRRSRSRSAGRDGKPLWSSRPKEVDQEKWKALTEAAAEKFPKVCIHYLAGLKGCNYKGCKKEHPSKLPDGFFAVCRKVGLAK